MKGQILDFSVQENSGIISGSDGARYSFEGADWKRDPPLVECWPILRPMAITPNPAILNLLRNRLEAFRKTYPALLKKEAFIY